MPPALAFLVLLVNDRDVMGDAVNTLAQNISAVAVALLLIIAGLGFGVATVFPHWFSWL